MTVLTQFRIKIALTVKITDFYVIDCLLFGESESSSCIDILTNYGITAHWCHVCIRLQHNDKQHVYPIQGFGILWETHYKRQFLLVSFTLSFLGGEMVIF